LLHAIQAHFDAIQPYLDAIQARLDAIQARLNAVKSGSHSGEIIAIASRLLKNMARDHLLAVDLAFEHADASFELLSGHLCGHVGASPFLATTITQVVITASRLDLLPAPAGGGAVQDLENAVRRQFA
jgi:hypothetical protein